MGGKAHGGRRVEREEALAIANKVLGRMTAFLDRWEIAGSLRRGRDEAGDVDLVVLPKKGCEVKVDLVLVELFGLMKNGNPAKSGLVDGVQVDVNIATPEGWGAMLMFTTGSWQWNVMQRTKARNLGLKLNEKGLWKGDERIAGATEDEVYEALGLEMTEPGRRETVQERVAAKLEATSR